LDIFDITCGDDCEVSDCNRKCFVANLFARGRIVPQYWEDGSVKVCLNVLERWIRVENYEYHGGPLWSDTVESMYWGLLYSSSNANRPDAEGWFLDMVGSRRAGRTAVRLEDNTITLRFNIYFNFSELDYCCGKSEGTEEGGETLVCKQNENCICDPPISSVSLGEPDIDRVHDDCSGQDVCKIAGDDGNYIGTNIECNLFLLATEYARVNNGKPSNYMVDFDNITFEQLVAAGLMLFFASDFTGTIYDFFPGMQINTRAVVNRAENLTPRHSAIDFRIRNVGGLCSGAASDSRVIMNSRSLSFRDFATVSAHEVGHLVGGPGLSDAYGGRLSRFRSERPRRAANDGYGIRATTGIEITNSHPNNGLMRGTFLNDADNGVASPNDFEMILLAFVDNERQRYIPGGSRIPSRAIKSDLTYFRRGTAIRISDEIIRELRWDSANSRFIPKDVEPKTTTTYYNGFVWDYFEDVRDNETVVVILGIHSGDRTQSVRIPETINGFPVVEINNGAFRGETFSEVYIHAGITSIGIDAFRDNLNLRSVNFDPDINLEVIDSRVFMNTPSLATITLPDTVNTIRWRAFRCSGLRTITIPGNVTRIENEALSRCNNSDDYQCGNEGCAARDNLRTVIFEGTTPIREYFATGIFANSLTQEPNVAIFVPRGTRNEYYNAFPSGRPRNRLLTEMPLDEHGNPAIICNGCGLLSNENPRSILDLWERLRCVCCEICVAHPCECCDNCGGIGDECVCEYCDVCKRLIFDGTDNFDCLCCDDCGEDDCRVCNPLCRTCRRFPCGCCQNPDCTNLVSICNSCCRICWKNIFLCERENKCCYTCKAEICVCCPVCDTPNCDVHCYHCRRENCDWFHCRGDVLGQGWATQESAIEILRLLVCLPNIIVRCRCETTCEILIICETGRNELLWNAALITSKEVPTVFCAIAILRFIIDLPTKELEEIWGRTP
jgi:hypothetical protein